MPTNEIYLLNTGWATAPEWVMIEGGRRKETAVPSMVGLLRHPVHGWGLFDAGYAPRILDATAHGVFRLYSRLVPMRVTEDDTVVAQLARLSLAAEDIQWIVVSHFHPDHIAGLKDFPRARFITAKAAYDGIRFRRGWRALQRGFIPSLLPEDFAERATLLGEFSGPNINPFGPGYDLFGDESLILCNLSGHAAGQLALLASTTRGRVLLAADGCWLTRSYRENRPPHWVTAVFVESLTKTRRTVSALHDFATANSDVKIIPTHCPMALSQWAEAWNAHHS